MASDHSLCFVLIQMLNNGMDDLVKGAVLIRIAEILNYSEVKLEVKIKEKESRLTWTEFDGVLVRFGIPAAEAELVQKVVPHRFRDQYLGKLGELLDQPRSKARSRLRSSWKKLSNLARHNKDKEFTELSEALVSWLLDHVRSRITKIEE